MRLVPAATLITGVGLEGDKHAVAVSDRQVLLADKEALDAVGVEPGTIKENLTVEGSRFRDNENGILSGPSPRSRIVIRNSVFTGNGKCDPECAHGIYIGAIDSLGVAGCTFLQQNEGHHIKSRALHTEIVGNTIKDGPAGTASFAVDVVFPVPLTPTIKITFGFAGNGRTGAASRGRTRAISSLTTSSI